jgi:hypothetical protein
MSDATRRRSSSKKRTGDSSITKEGRFSVFHDVHLSTFRHLLIAISIVYVGLPILFYILPQVQPGLPEGVLVNVNANSDTGASAPSPPSPSSTAGPFAAAHPSSDTKSPFIRFVEGSGFTLATPFKLLWLSSTYLVSSLIKTTRFILSPILYLVQLVSYTASYAFQPFRFILDPLALAARILLAPIVAPLYGLYRLLTAFYPVYVFMTASCICGVIVGWGAKWVSVFVVNGVIAMMDS